MKRFFMTGTDTDCGKTFVTCLLQQWLSGQGICVQAIKPVASGVTDDHRSDAALLRKNNVFPLEKNSLFEYSSPVSPHLAAKEAGQIISLREINNFCQGDNFKSADILLIEGAGGLLVPLNDEQTWIDFLKLSSIPVILVVGIRLGCINHALLSEYVLRANNISICGWIANIIAPETLMIEENIRSLCQRMQSQFLGRVNHQGGLEMDESVNRVYFI